MEANEKQHITEGAKNNGNENGSSAHGAPAVRYALCPVLHTLSHLIPKTVLEEGNDCFHASVFKEFK